MNESNMMNAVVNYSSTNDSVTFGDCTLDWDYGRTWSQPIREYYPYLYPLYINSPRYEDIYKKAFSIAKLLLKKKLLTSRKLKDFIGLVEEIAKVL